MKTIKFEFIHDDNRDYSFLNIDHKPNYDFSELRMKAEEILKPKLPDILKAASEKLNIYEWIVEILLLKTNTSLFHSIEIYPKKIKFPIFQLAPLDDAFLHYPTAYSYSAITLDESYLDMLNKMALNEVTLLYAYNGKETDIQITEPFISLYFEFENFINDLKINKLFPMNPYGLNMDMNFDCIQIMIFNNVNPDFKWTAFFCQEDFDYYSTDNTSINHINQSDFLKTMIKGNVIQNGKDYLDIITNDNIHEVLNHIKIINY